MLISAIVDCFSRCLTVSSCSSSCFGRSYCVLLVERGAFVCGMNVLERLVARLFGAPGNDRIVFGSIVRIRVHGG